MAWVSHNGRRYYYHKVRHGRRVRAIYAGNGPLAELVAIEDAEAAAARIRRLARRTPALLQVNIGEQQVNTANVGQTKPRRRATGQVASPAGSNPDEPLPEPVVKWNRDYRWPENRGPDEDF